MNLQSIIGNVALGQDTSGRFRSSIYGLAVRVGSGDRFVAWHQGSLVDVSDLLISGMDAWVYRVPVRKVTANDVIVRSDDPFSVIFVDKASSDSTVTGIDPETGDVVEYRPPTNLLGVHLFVRVSSALDGIAGHSAKDSLLPLLLLSGGAGGAGPTAAPGGGLDPMTLLLLTGGLGKRLETDSLLLPLLMRGSAGGDSSGLLLAWMASGGDLFAPGNAEGRRRGRRAGGGRGRRGERGAEKAAARGEE